MFAALGLPVLALAQGRQTIDPFLGQQQQAAAAAAVAAVWPPLGHVFLAPEADAAVAAATRLQLDFNTVNEHARWK
jgi:hypothetical protein